MSNIKSLSVRPAEPRPLIVGGVLIGLGGVLGLAGIVVSGAAWRRRA